MCNCENKDVTREEFEQLKNEVIELAKTLEAINEVLGNIGQGILSIRRLLNG